MGVKYFQSFISEHNADRKLLFPINITDLIKKQKDGSKTIVLDVKGCITHLYNRSGLVYGGQLKELEENLIKFVTNITSAGGNIVAFYDGMHEPNKHATWVERRTEAAQNIQQFYAKIRNEEKIDDSDITLITAAEEVTVQCTLKSLPNCQLRYSVKECDQDIMEYMRDNHCLALISNDTDYLIFDVPDFNYLSSKHLNLTEMTTMAYDRKAIRDILGLRQSQMPLFACLSGNDFILLKDLERFHQQLVNQEFIRSSEFEKTLLAVAQFVKKYPEEYIPYIPSLAQAAGVREDILRESIAAYKCEKKGFLVASGPKDFQYVVQCARVKHLKAELPTELYEMLLKQEYIPRLCVEDKNSLSVENWSRPLRRTLYKILFYGFTRSMMKEYIISPLGINFTYVSRVKTRKIYRPQTLLNLWATDARTKWLTLCSCVNKNLEFSQLCQLKDHLKIPAIALFYINRRGDSQLMTKHEICILAAHVVQVKNMTTKYLRSIQVETVNKRALDLAAKFNHVCSLIYLINGTCGFCIPPAQCSPANYFDGKLFADTYTKYTESRSVEFKMNSAEEVDDLRAIMSLLSMEKIHLPITYE